MPKATSAIPPSWTIAGIAGPMKGWMVEARGATSGGVYYDHSPFPKTIKPSPLLPAYTKETEIDVLARFEAACRYITGRCATSAPCNAYFKSLGAGVTLSDLLGWNIMIGFWKPMHRQGPGDPSILMAEVLAQGQNAKGEPWAQIAMTEYSLRTPIALAATIIHELAHVAGAPGATEDERAAALKKKDGKDYKRLIAAEEALKACLLPKQFDPGALGVLQGPDWRGKGGTRVV